MRILTHMSVSASQELIKTMAAEYDHQSLLIGVVYTKRALAFKTQDAALSSKQHVFKSLTAFKCSAIVWIYIVELFMCSINWKVNAFCVNRLHWGPFAQNVFLHKKCETSC